MFFQIGGWCSGNEAVWAISDEVASACPDECRTNHRVMFGLEILEERTLFRLFFCGTRNIYRLHGIRIQPRIEHTG